MSVGSPPAGLQIHLNVATHGGIIPKLNHGSAKIGSAFDAEESGVKYCHGPSVKGSQASAVQALLLPDALEETFRRPFPAVVKGGNHTALPAPAGVEVVGVEGHVSCFCSARAAKSSGCGCQN